MPILRVDDPADPRLRPFAGLRQRGPSPTLVVEGEIAVARALAGGHPMDALLMTAAHRRRLHASIPASLPVYEASAALVREVVGFDFHRGCLAVMTRPVMPSPESLFAEGGSEPALVVVAEGLADPANLGAVVRNARAFGARAVLHGRGADPWSRRAIRASMGLSLSLPVIGCPDLPAAVDAVRARLGPRARVVAAVVRPTAVPLDRYRASPRSIVLVGNEGSGLSAPLLARADDAVTVPLAPGVDSLNVAAATAVVLWSMTAAAR